MPSRSTPWTTSANRPPPYADEAVRQYKIAKEKERSREGSEYQVRQLVERLADIKAKPETEWTPEEAALVRGAASRDFWKGYEEECYHYNSDPERDYHFSMLRRFQNTRIGAAV